MAGLIANGQYSPSFKPNGNWNSFDFLKSIYDLLASIASRIACIFTKSNPCPRISSQVPPVKDLHEVTKELIIQPTVCVVAKKILGDETSEPVLLASESGPHISTSPRTFQTCDTCKISGALIKRVSIPKLKPGEKWLYRSGDLIEGEDTLYPILVDGSNAYIFSNKKAAKGGATHIPKLAVDYRTGQKVLLQTVEIDSKAKRRRIENEIEVAEFCNQSPFFPKLLSHIEDGGSIHLIYEFRDRGDLQDYIDRRVETSKAEALQITYDVLRGLQFLHGKGLAHCDMKPANIVLYEKNGRLRANIIDLESVTSFGQSQTLHTPSFLIDVPGRESSEVTPQRDFLSTIEGLKPLLGRAGLLGEAFNACCVSMMKDPHGYLSKFESFAKSQGVQLIQ